MQAWANPPKYGCINNPAYIAVVHAATLAVLNTSADGVQHDDAATNGGAVGCTATATLFWSISRVFVSHLPPHLRRVPCST